MEPMTQERLRSYVSIRMEVDNQLERLVRMKNQEQIPAVKQGDESQHTGGAGGRMERAIIRRMEYEDRVLPQIEAAQKEMATVEAAVYAVEDPMEREVLRLRYLSGKYCRLMPWSDVAESLFGDNDERHLLAAYRIHRRALKTIRESKA